MPKEMLFVLDGKILQPDEVAKYPILAAGFVAEDLTFVFETQEAFEVWANRTNYAETINSIVTKIVSAKPSEGAENSAVRAKQYKIIDRIKEDMTELAKRTGLNETSEELFLKATTKHDILEGPIFDPITAFDFFGTGGFAGGGSWIHLPGGGWPDLRWFGWNDRISSVRISGVALFCEHVWWGGRRLWLAGFPIYFHPNLGMFGFDNLTSSIWVA